MCALRDLPLSACELFYFCGGRSHLCHGEKFSCREECPPEEVISQIESLEQVAFEEAGAWSGSELRSVLSEGSSTLSLVLAERKIVAYALYRSVPPEAELLRIAVHPEQKRKGFASLILRDGFRVLRQKSIEELFLEVAAINFPALSLYASLGFQEVGKRPNYYPKLRSDAVVMRRAINIESKDDL